MPVNPGVEALPRRLGEVGAWTVDTVDDLPDLRAGLEARLRRGCPSSWARPGEPPSRLTQVQRIVLVTSELVANGLEHAVPPVTVRLLSDGATVVLDVVDRCPEAPPVVPLDRAPGEGGHGLRLAATLAHRVAWCRAGDEKHVWAEFAPAVAARATPSGALAAARARLGAPR